MLREFDNESCASSGGSEINYFDYHDDNLLQASDDSCADNELDDSINL